MTAALASATTPACANKAFTTQRPGVGRLPIALHQNSCSRFCKPVKELDGALTQASRPLVQTRVAPQLYELADRGSFIGGTAATIFAMTLIGLAIGFVLLRVEALTEEGKI